jgi:hypothetical protein
MMNKTGMRLGVLAGILLMLLSACNIGLTEPAGKTGPDGTVLLTVQVQDIAVRSLLPVISQTDITAYELWGGIGAAENKLLDFMNPSNVTVAVAPGTWNFTLKAYKDAALILQGTITGRVIPSAGNALAFSLAPLSVGTGTVKITINLPPNSGITQAAVLKDGAPLPTVTATGNSIVYESTISAGDYLYTFKLQDSTGAAIVVITEAVVVRSNIPTDAAIALGTEDLNFLAMAPTGLTAASQSDGSIKLQWNEVALATAYRVYRSTSGSFDASSTPVAGGTAYTDSAATTPGTYYYRVSAVNGAGEESQYSAVSMGVISLSKETPMSGNIVLTWGGVSGAVKYTLSRAVGAGAYSPVTTIDAPTVSYTDTGLNASLTYNYKVSALNSGNKEIAFSAAVSATPSASTVGISDFSFASPAASGIVSGTDISVTAPNIVNLSVLSPTITHTGISVSPASGTPQDFTGPVTYQVMASDGSTRDFTVTVNVTDRTLAGALTWINTNAVTNTEYTIVPLQNESLSPTSLTYTGKTVAITLKGGAAEKTISLGSNGSVFTVGSGTTLTLDSNITLQGRSNNASLVTVSTGGTLVMKDGAKITGNTRAVSSNSAGGSGVSVSGTFNMSGGTISNNIVSAIISGSANVGYASTVAGSNAGITSSNTISAYAYGGGVYVSGGTFTMTGGIISDNTVSASASNTFYSSASAPPYNFNYARAYAYGGGVYISSGSFAITGGTVNGNTGSSSATRNSGGYGSAINSSSGGGVYVAGGTFTKAAVTDCSIRSNSLSPTNTAASGPQVFVSDGSKYRSTDAGETVALNSAISGSGGGWGQ